jgi:ketosteroid isomerase-like protein
MRYYLATAMVVTVMAATVSAVGQIGSVSDKQLIGVIQDYLDAFGKLDVATMDRLETDDFVFVQDGVVLTKAQQMASLKAPGRKPGDLKFTISVKSEQMWVVADSAVMTGVLTATGADGRATRSAFTHLMRRSGQEWRIQHSHYSTEREPAAR